LITFKEVGLQTFTYRVKTLQPIEQPS